MKQAKERGKRDQSIVGVDLGGTNVRAGLVKSGRIAGYEKRLIRSKGTKEEVLEDLFAVVDPLMSKGVKAIGVGVPSLVDKKNGTLLDTTNIPSWKRVPLKKILEKRYEIPVAIENDANCFALAEYWFGAGRGCQNFVGLIVGTGLGAGIIANGQLVSGAFGGAGEFGIIPYRDGLLENYASGQFFRRFSRDGAQLSEAMDRGEPEAARIFGELGAHVGYALQVIMYALAPERIVLGGSVGQALRHYESAVRDSFSAFAYPAVAEQLDLRVSRIRHAGVLGAAGLWMANRY